MSSVWRGMTQSQLDRAYDQAAFAPNMREVVARYAARSATTRERLGQPKRFAYGPGRKEGLDIFSPQHLDGPAPISIFVHGGAWRSGAAHDYAFPAEPIIAAGGHHIAIDFDWVQECDGNLLVLVDQVRRAIAWVAAHASEFGGDPAKLHVAAHSSGAHLAGVALATDWASDFRLPPDVVKSAILCSGMYDMAPVRLSARSSYVTFTDDSEHALSIMRQLERISMPLVVAYGSRETPEFQRQSRDFVEALAARSHPVDLLVGEDLNHFEILETSGEADGLLGKALLRLIGLLR